MSDATENLKTHLALTRARLELLKAKKMSGGYSRHPSGSSKGGQFAPKGTNSFGNPSEPAPFKSGGNTFLEVGGPGWGSYKKPSAPPPGAKPHPAGVDDKGNPVTVNYPTKPSSKDTWGNKNATATFTPGGDTPSTLNGVPMKSWSPPKEGWHAVGGNNERLEALFPFNKPTDGKSTGAGVLIMESDGRVWLTKPTNEFGGYKQTYPKGTVESGLTMQQNAIKEAFEETGLKIKITGVLGDYDRTTSRARMYIAERVGGTPKDMGWESQAVRLATMKDAKTLLNMSHDKKILDDLQDLMEFAKAKGGSWQNQPRWPGGTPLGGQWKTMGADGLTMPPLIAGGLEGKNTAYQKAVNAAHAAAQKGDVAPVKQLISKYISKLDAFNAGQKGSSHLKWGAMGAQYGIQLLKDASVKPVAAATADRIKGPETLSDMGPVTGPKPGGSNPGALYTQNGQEWLVKGSNAAKYQDAATVADRSKNEVLAAKLMLAAGAGAPDMKLVELEGKYEGGLGVASKMIDGLTKLSVTDLGAMGAVRGDFAIHAWLANYDVLGAALENTAIKDGKAINIDPGGALLFRAQGEKKDLSATGGLLDPSAPEFESMRKTNDHQKAVYGKMMASDLAASAEKLNNISDDTIKSLVKTYGPGDEAFRDKLAQNLIDRKNAILDKAGLPFKMGVGASVAQPAAAPKEEKPAPTTQEVEAALLAKAMKEVNTISTLAKNGVANGVSYKAPNKTASEKLALLTSTYANDQNLQKIAAQMDKAYSAGDLSGLAMAKVGADVLASSVPAIKPFSMAASSLSVHAQNAMLKLAADNAKAAEPIAAAAPKIDIPPKPEFPSAKFGDTYYKGLAEKAEGLAGKGDLAGLKAMATSGKYAGGVPWKPGSPNGKVMAAYHGALVAKLEQQDASVVVARVQQAQVALQKPAAVPTPTDAAEKALPAMPNFAAKKLPADNTNASSHNAKVDVLEKLSAAGDVKGILSLGYGTNTYAKKQAQIANDVLAALGSPHVVTPGQKSNAHPALFGGVTAAQATIAAATVKTTPAKGVAKPKLDPSNLPMAKVELPEKPGLFTASSKSWVNDQNNKLVNEIETHLKAGNLTALQNMTFTELDKETGKALGTKHVSEAMAKLVNSYYDASVATLKDVASPPRPLKVFEGQSASSINSISRAFPSKPLGTTVASLPKNEQLGFWMALGKVDNISQFLPASEQDYSDAMGKAAYPHYDKGSEVAKNFINMMHDNSALANAYREGKTYHQNGGYTASDGGSKHNLAELTQAALAHSTAQPAGTRLYRWQNMPADMAKKLLLTEPGTVLQANGPMPTSRYATATKGFGKHRMEIIYADGARAVDSFGSKRFQSEMEVTTLPNSRFVLLSSKKTKDGYTDIKVLMLPPDVGLTTL